MPKNEDEKKEKIKKRLIHIECREINDWFNLIACNIVILSTLQEQVQYKEHIVTLDKDVSIRIPRSPSMSNIATVVQAAIKHVVDPHHDSFFRQVSHSPPTHQLSDRIGFHFRHRSPSPNNLNSKCPINKTDGLSLNGFLTKPIQSVTRYPLLIEKILKHVPIDHPEYQSIRQAFECARHLNERSNKQICEQENLSRLDHSFSSHTSIHPSPSIIRKKIR